MGSPPNLGPIVEKSHPVLGEASTITGFGATADLSVALTLAAGV